MGVSTTPGISTRKFIATKSSHPRGWAFPQKQNQAIQGDGRFHKTMPPDGRKHQKGTNWTLRIPRIRKQRLIYDPKNMHDFSIMSCHDNISSMCCVQIKSNMQDGLDRIQFNWIIHAQITNLRGAPKAPHSGAKRRPPPKAVGPRAPLGPRTLGRPTLHTAA